MFESYVKPSSCASDLITALIVRPVLSTEFIVTWNDSNTTIANYNENTYSIDHTVNDSIFRYEVDIATLLINSLEVLGYHATFYWGFYNDSIPYLDDVKILNQSAFQRGGVDFFNIYVNGVCQVAQRSPSAKKEMQASMIRQDGNGVHFYLQTGSRQAVLYTIAGKQLDRITLRQSMFGNSGYWNGRTRRGSAVAAGWYFLTWDTNGSRTSKKFFYGNR